MDNKKLVNEINWPCDMSLTTKLKLLAIAEPKSHISSGKISFVKDYNRGIHYVFDGLATFSLISTDMKPLVGGVMGYESWFGGMLTYNYPEITLHVAEIVPLQLLFFSKDKIEQLGQSDPEIFKFLYGIGQINQPRQFQAITISFYPIEIQLAYCLIEILAHKKYVNGEMTELKFTQQQFSDLTGLSRPRINEVLNQFQQEQLISLSRGAIKVINVDKIYEKLSDDYFDFYNPYERLLNSNDK